MAFLFWRLRRCDLELDSNSPCLYTLIRIFLAPAIVVTEALVPETEVKTEAPGFKAKTEAEAVASETEAKVARQLIGIGYSIPINIKHM